MCYSFGMLTKKVKSKVISAHARKDGDTGSPEVQIAIFTEEIERLAKHLKKHLKDHGSRRGLLKMVAKRKKLMEYLKHENPDNYAKLAKSLGLRA